MPRANRYIQPGCLYHLTHRCHDRRFLFRFALDRNEYRKRLRAAVNTSPVSLLAYCITSNHAHLLVEAGTTDGISIMMQQLEGQFAEWYNWRKKRSVAFWEDRYHCTIVDGNPHLLNCMVYIDMNMVRAGAVEHPRDWRWCGYDELVGRRQRYRLLDLDCVLKWQGGPAPKTFAREYSQWIDEAVQRRELVRNPIWTESIAVGSEDFVRQISANLRNRKRLQYTQQRQGVWSVREPGVSYGSDIVTRG